MVREAQQNTPDGHGGFLGSVLGGKENGTMGPIGCGIS